MGNAARQFVFKERSLELASAQLNLLLRSYTERRPMIEDAVWQPLRDELSSLDECLVGACRIFWLRDDDAVEPGDSLTVC